MQTELADAPTPTEGREEFDAYLEYNRILRSWFVAFGVGGPALFLANPVLGDHLVKAGKLRVVAALFLLGTGAQVLGAVINKVSNWYVYHGSQHIDFQITRRYKWNNLVVHWFAFDIVLDLITCTLFGLSAWELLTVLAHG